MECSHLGCKLTFYRKDNLRRHEATHNKEKKFQCLYCTSKFNRKDAMLRHVTSIHNGGSVGTSQNYTPVTDTFKIFKTSTAFSSATVTW